MRKIGRCLKQARPETGHKNKTLKNKLKKK